MKKLTFVLFCVLSVTMFAVSVFACPLHDAKVAAEKTVDKV